MKSITLLFVIVFSFTATAHNIVSDTIKNTFEKTQIRNILSKWDATAGVYLFESVDAMVSDGSFPSRPASIKKTSFELLQVLNEATKTKLNDLIYQQIEKRNISEREAQYWQKWDNLLNYSNCSMQRGRSHGDPHIVTFDKVQYDFQNAGDYLLIAALDKGFKIQTQQVRIDESIAVIDGVAMNVNGDIVEFGTYHDLNQPKLRRINNKVISSFGSTIYLAHGGIIDFNKGDFVVKWPTGEQLHISQRSFREKQLLDLSIYVPQCNSNYKGLLGNNDGKKNDLVVVTSSGRKLQRGEVPQEDAYVFGEKRNSSFVRNKKEREAYFITHTFGDQFIVREGESIFYQPMTDVTDNIRYPREVLSLHKLTDKEIQIGLKKAREAGVKQENFYAAVYDYGYLGIEPIAFENKYEPPVRTMQPKNEDVPKIPIDKRKTTQENKSPTGADVIRDIGRNLSVPIIINSTTRRHYPETRRAPTQRKSPTRRTGNTRER